MKNLQRALSLAVEVAYFEINRSIPMESCADMPLDQSLTTPRTTIHRLDYTPPAYLVDHVDLDVVIQEGAVVVASTLSMRPNPQATDRRLVLQGVGLTTRSITVDGQAVSYDIQGEDMILAATPDAPFQIRTMVELDPASNTALSGLYVSGDMLCTQCEAEGFRRITWFPDRPDVMSRYRVAITADRGRYPVLLSNGNQVAAEDLPDGRHRVVWDDPFPKPSYLFALVAGDLALVAGTFTTRSGRVVDLKFWVEHGNEDQTQHALLSLQKSMAWDEEVYGLEYDLDIYNVVAVSHFNMGAMENKSLNVFNSKYVLAKQQTATDGDFLGVEAVIAHEYFHNWTGNRVTCRDWFQLTLKEGLTVFRDQEFSSDLNSRAIKRIQDVWGLRAGQFPEDNGPMAHPIRPDSYVEINNFYTATVYQKGAEVIRMIHTLIGAAAFRAGMDLYFARHDGQAVTCEDFVKAMEDASGHDLGQFRRWYSQAGTPRLTAHWHHDDQADTLTLTLEQSCPPSPGQEHKDPYHIPVVIGLVGPDGSDLPLRLTTDSTAQGGSRTLSLCQDRQSWTFAQVPAGTVPSLCRGFSAPVKVLAPYTNDQLAFLLAHDSDLFNRWDAGQELAARILLGLVDDWRQGRPLVLNDDFVHAWGKVLGMARNDPAFAASALALPSFGILAERMEVVDVDGLYAARNFVLKSLAQRYQAQLHAIYNVLQDDRFLITPAAMQRRSMRNMALGLLSELQTPDVRDVALEQFRSAGNMTDQFAALASLVNMGQGVARQPLADFLHQWQGEKLVVNKWFGLQAMADHPDVLAQVQALLHHPMYDAGEPNKIYALVGGFAANQPWFHAADGAGYRFMADQVMDLDGANPQVASRMVRSLIRWKRYDATRQALMTEQLRRIQAKPDLSRDVGEIVGKALA